MHTRHHRSLRLLALSLPVLLTASCSDDFMPGPLPEGILPMQFACDIDQDNTTRADESGFANGDRMGVFVVNYRDGSPGTLTLSGNQANNVALTFDQDANKWNAATDIYWLDKSTPADIYGYYPFSNGLSSVTDYSFEVNADQSKPAADCDICSYEASDFLWAKAERATPGQKVNLTYTHRMAGVKVVLQEGSGFADGQWAKVSKLVTVDNTTRHSTIDLQTGTVTATGGFDRNIVMNDDATGWRAVVVPQTVAAGKTTIGITIDGKPFSYTREGGMKYTAGKMHTFTIKVDWNESAGTYSLSLTSENITDWESDNTSHDFVENTYVTVHCQQAGKLREVLQAAGIDFYSVRNLKVTGTLTTEDFYFMRDELSSLTAVNLQNINIVNGFYRSQVEKMEGGGLLITGDTYENDVLPGEAFRNKNTLRRILLPETIKKIGDSALCGLKLNSTLAIPESVTHIYIDAFSGIGEGCTLVMPHHLEYIGIFAFMDCGADIELFLANSIHYIGAGAFVGANVHGRLNIPSKLEFLGEWALCVGDKVEGEIVIPPTMKEIPDYAFCGVNIKGGTKVTFHDGITKIGEGAFAGISFAPGFTLPKNLKEIGRQLDPNPVMYAGNVGAFMNCDFADDIIIPESVQVIVKGTFAYSNLKGKLTIPSGINVVSSNQYSQSFESEIVGSFAYTQLEEVVINKNVEIIGERAFLGNERLKSVEIGRNVHRIATEAFADCSGLQSIVCLAKDPPKLSKDAFRGLNPHYCHLEVPEESIELYRNTDGWRDFQFISAHRELTVGIHGQSCLNKGLTRSSIIYSEGEWRVKSTPSWIHVVPDHASNKEEITFTIDPLSQGAGDRQGKVVFELIGKDYTTDCDFHQFDYNFPEDSEIVLQSATADGSPVNLFIVGDGFGAEDIVNGKYLELMKENAEQFFAIEPYKTYKNCFNVSTAIAMSPDDKVATLQNRRNDRLGTFGVELDIPTVKNYAATVSDNISSSNLSKAMIVVVSNMDAFDGKAYPDEDGCALACISLSNEPYPYDQRGLVQHYAGGLAFAGLATEYITHNENIKGCKCPGCNALLEYYGMESKGMFENISLSGKINEVPWREFIFHPKYSSIVDMWEGGYKHYGVWRSENQSVMSTYIAYYNTVSRYAIYKAIMRRSGLSPSLEEFIANDKIEQP